MTEKQPIFWKPVDLQIENKMGGGEIPERLRVPHYTTYSYENVNKFPELVKYQQQLAKDGLKDPWLRLVLHANAVQVGGVWPVLKIPFEQS